MTATHTEREAFLRYIIEHPDDDGPRLALADWLDEHAGYVECPEPGCGNPAVGWNGFYRCTCKDGHVSNGCAERAEFIRVQCELARYSEPHPSWDASGKLARRSRELLSQFGEQWAMEELMRPCGWKLDDDFWINGNEIISAKEVHDGRVWIKWHYSRGFIGRVECTTETLMGRVCRRCNGRGVLSAGSCGGQGLEDLDEKCSCDVGRIPGIARLLGENVPVMEVVLTDLHPYNPFPRTETDQWAWFDAKNMQGRNNEHPQSEVPHEIWELIDMPKDSRERCRTDSEAVARSALARAAADYCRSLAGLPRLEVS